VTMTTHSRAPLTKTARHAKILSLLEQHQVRSQTELAELLAADGLTVTQGTLSRDLVDLGALRVRGAGGHLVYAVPGEGGDRSPQWGEFAGFEARLARLCQEAAQYFGSAIDRVGWESILGTIAGDDTILLITREPDGGAHTAEQFLTMSRTGKPVTALEPAGDPTSEAPAPATTKD
jgi:transcriptional regulator of arginine metabolism